MLKVSLYKSFFTGANNPGVHVDINVVVKSIKTGSDGTRAKTERLRKLYTTDNDRYTHEKERSDSVTWSGTFPPGKRIGDKLIQHSGYVVLDIDDDIDIVAVREHLTGHPNVRFAFLSPSGRGYKPLIKVNPIPQNKVEHEIAFNAVLEVFAGYTTDKELAKQRDPNRLCVLAYDPEPIQNNQAVPVEWEMPAPAPELPSSAPTTLNETETEYSPPSESEAIDLLRHIPNDCEYSRWVEIGMAIKDAGLPMSVFQEWSGGQRKKSSTGEWIDVDIAAQWNRLNGSGITWGSAVHLAKENGYKPEKKPKPNGDSDKADKLYPYDIAEAFMQSNHYWFTHDELHQYNDKNGLYEPCAPKVRKSARLQFGSQVNTSKVNEVENHITDMAYRSDFACDGLVFKNGVLDLDTMEMSPHSPDSYHLTGYPVNYLADEKPTVTPFRDYLFELTQDSEGVTTLFEMIGSCFDPGVFEMRTVFLLTGSGSNGKSTLLDIIEELVGMHNISRTPFTDYGIDRWAKGGLVDKALALDDDIDPTKPLGPALKSLVTKKVHEVELKYRNSFPYPLEATFIGAINGQPHTSDTSDAFWDRFLVLDFPMTFEKDATARQRLMSEFTSSEMLDSIATFSVNLYAQAKCAGVFTRPERSEEMVAMFQENSNHIITFANERLVHSPDVIETRRDVRAAYGDWCDDNHVTKPYSSKRFWQSLWSQGFKDGKPRKIEGKVERVIEDVQLTI